MAILGTKCHLFDGGLFRVDIAFRIAQYFIEFLRFFFNLLQSLIEALNEILLALPMAPNKEIQADK